MVYEFSLADRSKNGIENAFYQSIYNPEKIVKLEF